MDISVVCSIHNCDDTLTELYTRLSETFKTMQSSYELIFINDHSSDKSWASIKELHRADPHVKGINFSRQYGQSAALQAGFEKAKGDLVFTISPTLENGPEDLPKLIDFMKAGELDVVVGFRKGKFKGRFLRKFVADFANFIVSMLIDHKIQDMTSPVRLFKRNVLLKIKIYGDHHMFLPALASLYGAKFGEVEIEHNKPKTKDFKYKPLHISKTLLDIVVIKFLLSMSTPPFSMAPIRIFGGSGLVSLSVGFLLGLYLTVQKLVYHQQIGNRPLLLLSALFIMLGALFFVLGLLGELIVRVYFEIQNKATYHVKEQLG